MSPESRPLSPAPASWTAAPRALAVDLARALRFQSRLPVPVLPWEGDPHAAPDFAAIARVQPLAGAIIGSVGAAALAAGLALGLGPGLSALLALAALVLATGALHEDGLADTADGFGGGGTRERRLEIMRDSRIGSYGGAALALSLALRAAAIAGIAERAGAPAACAALVLVAALSRTAMLQPLAALPPARTSGASHAAGRPPPRAVAVAWGGCAALALALVPAGLWSPGPLALGLGAAALAGIVLTRLARRLIGGQTGDIAGATQQAAEIGALIGLLAGLRP